MSVWSQAKWIVRWWIARRIGWWSWVSRWVCSYSMGGMWALRSFIWYKAITICFLWLNRSSKCGFSCLMPYMWVWSGFVFDFLKSCGCRWCSSLLSVLTANLNEVRVLFSCFFLPFWSYRRLSAIYWFVSSSYCSGHRALMIWKTTGVCWARSGKRSGTFLMNIKHLISWEMVRLLKTVQEISRWGSNTSLISSERSRPRRPQRASE